MRSAARVDLTGRRFGIVTVLKRTKKTKYEHRSPVYRCVCDCGRKKYLSAAELRTAKSCGCRRLVGRELLAFRNKGRPAANALPPGEAKLRATLRRYRRSAAGRGLSFSLEPEQVRTLIMAPCAYCGAPPTSGIDRVDNTRGYQLDNCVACCPRCNRAKGVMTISEFRAWIREIHRRLPDP